MKLTHDFLMGFIFQSKVKMDYSSAQELIADFMIVVPSLRSWYYILWLYVDNITYVYTTHLKYLQYMVLKSTT